MNVWDVLSLDVLRGARLVAGKEHCDRRVTWVNLMEILDSLEQLQEGEFLISTGYGLFEGSHLLEGLVGNLCSRNLAALAIQPGYYINSIPARLIDDADRHGLPVIEIPPKITFGKITRALLDELTNRHIRLLENSRQLGNLVAPIRTPREVEDGSEDEGSFIGEFFDEILDSSSVSRYGALIRAGALGITLSRTYKVAVVSLGDGEDTAVPEARRSTAMVRSILARRCTMAKVIGNLVVVVYSTDEAGGKGSRPAAMDWTAVRREIAAAGDTPVSVGVGLPVRSWPEFQKGFRQAIKALEVGRCLWRSGFVSEYSEIEPLSILVSVKDKSSLEEFYNRTVGPLAEYDKENSTDLCRTLDTFLRVSSRKDAAKALFVHRHTLDYRLTKIEEITGHRISDANDRFRLYLGFLIHALLRPEPSSDRSQER
ncbi:MAG: hypothetical protein HPY55_04850 [Firmicutes bacterium]|nr:hypothetical protein [Bacillota bacterium]